MNAALLNALSAAISDNPIHVLQLRKVVVALAMSGRLDQTEGSIGRDEILALLDDVKRRLIAQRFIAKQKPVVAISNEQLPEDFSDPSKFISLGQVARVEKGKTGIQQAKAGHYPLVVTASERLSADHFDFDTAAAIIPLVSSTGHGNASINRLHYQEGQFALGTILAAVLPHEPALFSARFLFEYLSAFKDELLVSRMSGTANVTLTLGRIEEVPIPLVPPAIQRQVDQLMALCDELEAARTERETRRDRLAAASLARLNTPDPETFRDDARFALDVLPALSARPDQIKQLRQTILNLAVRGKLVPQDPADEPAAELLKRISALTPGANVPRFPMPDFELPSNWSWTGFGQLVDHSDAGWSPKTEDYPRRGDAWGVLKVSAVSWDTFRPQENKQVLPGTVVRQQAVIKKGDFLISRANTAQLIARAVIVDIEPTNLMMSDKIVRLSLKDACVAKYAWIVNNYADFARQHYVENASGVSPSMKNVSRSAILGLPFPLPPLAEQHRIVAKVDELMALCDQLETSLTISDKTRKKLLDALLAEALAPVGVDVLQEAAE